MRYRGREFSVEGNCFEDSAEHVLHAEVLGQKLLLAHGEVAGRGPLEGVRFAHAWVEDGDDALDVSKGVRMPRAVYYALGEISSVHRYTAADIRRWAKKTEHWGPWELKSSTGL